MQVLVAAAVALHLVAQHGAGLAVGRGLKKHGSASIAEQYAGACRARLEV